MSAAPTLLPPRAVYTNELIYRLSVDQYHDLINSGTLANDSVELLEGLLVPTMPKNPPHSNSNGRIGDLIRAAITQGWFYRSQEPITLTDGEPEPDGAVVRGSINDYASAHPGPDDVGLLIEVADSTLDRDRGIKLRSYARAGIVCYWIVNLIDWQIEVYTQPEPAAKVPAYHTSQIFKPGESVPFQIPGETVSFIPVADILPAT